MKLIPASEIIGKKFGRIVVLKEVPKKTRDRRFLCRCVCGVELEIGMSNFTRGNGPSCGCARIKHGQSGSRTIKTWQGMIQRCNNPKSPKFYNYGGRGIKVCERWLVFVNFLADMGLRPEGMTIERIDNNGNYEPSNCRWATRSEQCRNTRFNHFISINGVSKTLAEWSEISGMRYGKLLKRILRGWEPERAIKH